MFIFAFETKQLTKIAVFLLLNIFIVVVVDTYNFDNHITHFVFDDVNAAAFALVAYEKCNETLWCHKTKPGFYALLSFPV